MTAADALRLSRTRFETRRLASRGSLGSTRLLFIAGALPYTEATSIGGVGPAIDLSRRLLSEWQAPLGPANGAERFLLGLFNASQDRARLLKLALHMHPGLFKGNNGSRSLCMQSVQLCGGVDGALDHMARVCASRFTRTDYRGLPLGLRINPRVAAGF
jgi:hypothetical protein